MSITFHNPNQLSPQPRTLSAEAHAAFLPLFLPQEWELSAHVRVRSHLSLSWPGLHNREARGRKNSSSILPKTVPSLLRAPPCPAGLGPPAAALRHLWSPPGAPLPAAPLRAGAPGSASDPAPHRRIAVRRHEAERGLRERGIIRKSARQPAAF